MTNMLLCSETSFMIFVLIASFTYCPVALSFVLLGDKILTNITASLLQRVTIYTDKVTSKLHNMIAFKKAVCMHKNIVT